MGVFERGKKKKHAPQTRQQTFEWLKHVPFTRSLHRHAHHRSARFSSISPIPYVIMPTDASVYLCQCTVCKRSQKKYSARTIKTHLQRDRNFLESLAPSEAQLASFVRLSIDLNIELLSGIYNGLLMPETTSGAQGSRSEGFESVQSSLF